MKKIFLIGAFLFSIFAIEKAYSYDSYGRYNSMGYSSTRYSPMGSGSMGYDSMGYSSMGYSSMGSGSMMGDSGAPCDQPCGECWCRYVRYEPCYSTTKRCVEEQIPCKKRCCRYVQQCYEVQKCRYVPQYYSETCTRQVPEYYDVDDCRTCKRVICEPQCRYVPKYYWKKVCPGEAGCCN